MRGHLVALAFLFLVPAAPAKSPLETATHLFPGDRLDLALDALGDVQFFFEADKPVLFAVANGSDPRNAASNYSRAEHFNWSFPDRTRLVMSWLNSEDTTLRLQIGLAGDVRVAGSEGLRQLDPESWRAPAPEAALVLLCLGALAAGARRR